MSLVFLYRRCWWQWMYNECLITHFVFYLQDWTHGIEKKEQLKGEVLVRSRSAGIDFRLLPWVFFAWVCRVDWVAVEISIWPTTSGVVCFVYLWYMLNLPIVTSSTFIKCSKYWEENLCLFLTSVFCFNPSQSWNTHNYAFLLNGEPDNL